jgi:Xaa-Pro aminopeptidase
MSTLAERKSAVLRRMEASGVETLLLTASGRHMIDEADPVKHLTGFLSLGPAMVALGSDGRATLVAAPADDAERMAARASGAKCVATDDVAGALAAVLKGGRLGRVAAVNWTGLPHGLYANLCRQLGAEPAAWDAEFDAVTGAKTEAELASARHGAAIAEQAYARLLATARAGMRECDLGAELNLYMKELGANDTFFMFNAGKNVPGVMPSSERRIEPGDLLLVELSPSCDGQFVQICRTVSIGQPSQELREKYALLTAAMQDGITRVRPGAKVSDICDAIDARMAAAGYGKYSRPPFLRRRGHGLACGSMAPGDVAFDNPTALEPDMLFMVHPNQFLPGPGYMMCGEPVRVTGDGVEVLTQQMAALGVVEG